LPLLLEADWSIHSGEGGGKIAFAPCVGHLDSALYNKFPMYKERCFSHAFNFFSADENHRFLLHKDQKIGEGTHVQMYRKPHVRQNDFCITELQIQISLLRK
jgi:hypothetical protein